MLVAAHARWAAWLDALKSRAQLCSLFDADNKLQYKRHSALICTCVAALLAVYIAARLARSQCDEKYDCIVSCQFFGQKRSLDVNAILHAVSPHKARLMRRAEQFPDVLRSMLSQIRMSTLLACMQLHPVMDGPAQPEEFVAGFHDSSLTRRRWQGFRGEDNNKDNESGLKAKRAAASGIAKARIDEVLACLSGGSGSGISALSTVTVTAH